MSQQQPIPSGLGARTTAREALGDLRLDGKTAVVTGGYAGIGLETTRVLAGAGARVIVPARNRTKAERALAGIANVAVDGNTLTFDREVVMGDMTIKLSYKVTADGNTLTGNTHSDFGDIPITGTRQ